MTELASETTATHTPLRIALVGPVAQSIPPERSGSVETVTAMLADGLVTQGQDVTLFATGSSETEAQLHAMFPNGYHHDSSMWPWELCELFNLAAAVERAHQFDLIHYQAEYSPISLAYTHVSPIPLLQTLHHAPVSTEIALWSRYPEAPFIAVSQTQAQLMSGLNVVQTIHHAVDPDLFTLGDAPQDYLLFLGRFTEGKGILSAIEVAKQTNHRLIIAAAENQYYRDTVRPLVDGQTIVYVGEVDLAAKISLLQGARVLLYPVQSGESFGLVMTEAMMCGTPVAALDQGTVSELVDDYVTGRVFQSLEALIRELDSVVTLDRTNVRSRALDRFNPEQMVDKHIKAYKKVLSSKQSRQPRD